MENTHSPMDANTCSSKVTLYVHFEVDKNFK